MLHNVVTESDNLRSYLLVAQAAQRIGVHPDTLRRWERTGKLKTYRHPINRYRLYKTEDLDRIINEVSIP